MNSQGQRTNDEGQRTPVVLTVAGLDPSGGAGVIADIKTITAFDCFPTAAVTSLTFQNTTGVFGAIHQTAESVRSQVVPILEDFKVAAVKTGMLPTGEIIREVARLIREHNLPAPVVDPVVRSTSGYDLIDGAALRVLIEELFPLARIVTPNIPEAGRIINLRIEDEADVWRAGKEILDMGAQSVLIKGGHRWKSNGVEMQADDVLFIGDDVTYFSAEWIETTATHGTGCTLASGIAANLALGRELGEAVEAAKEFVTAAIRSAPHIGRGHSPINHGFNAKTRRREDSEK